MGRHLVADPAWEHVSAEVAMLSRLYHHFLDNRFTLDSLWDWTGHPGTPAQAWKRMVRSELARCPGLVAAGEAEDRWGWKGDEGWKISIPEVSRITGGRDLPETRDGRCPFVPIAVKHRPRKPRVWTQAEVEADTARALRLKLAASFGTARFTLSQLWSIKGGVLPGRPPRNLEERARDREAWADEVRRLLAANPCIVPSPGKAGAEGWRVAEAEVMDELAKEMRRRRASVARHNYLNARDGYPAYTREETAEVTEPRHQDFRTLVPDKDGVVIQRR